LTSPDSTNVPLWTKPYTLTVLATFFLFIPCSLFFPVLPVYILDELHGTPAAAGAANAAFLIAMVLFRAQTDRFERRFGSRTVLFASGLLFACSNFLFLVAGSTTAIIIIRFFSGVVFAIATTAILALGGQLAPLKRKGEGLAYLTTTVSVGTAIGPFAGLLLARTYGFKWVFFFCGLLALGGCFISRRIAIPSTKASDPLPARGYALHDLYEVRAVPASSIALLLMIAISAVLSFVTVYASSMNLHAAAAYFFIVLALSGIGSRILTGRLYDRFGADFVIYPAILFLAFGLFILGKAHDSFSMFASAGLIGSAYGITAPSFQTLAFHQSPPHRANVVTATYFTFYDLGLGAGAYLAGVLIPLLGYANIYLLLSPFVLSAALLYYVICRRKKGHVEIR
jgi:predicted MFS family arabinose efflux permease